MNELGKRLQSALTKRVAEATMLYGLSVVIEILEHGTAESIGKMLTCELSVDVAKNIVALYS